MAIIMYLTGVQDIGRQVRTREVPDRTDKKVLLDAMIKK